MQFWSYLLWFTPPCVIMWQLKSVVGHVIGWISRWLVQSERISTMERMRTIEKHAMLLYWNRQQPWKKRPKYVWGGRNNVQKNGSVQGDICTYVNMYMCRYTHMLHTMCNFEYNSSKKQCFSGGRECLHSPLQQVISKSMNTRLLFRIDDLSPKR